MYKAPQTKLEQYIEKTERLWTTTGVDPDEIVDDISRLIIEPQDVITLISLFRHLEYDPWTDIAVRALGQAGTQDVIRMLIPLLASADSIKASCAAAALRHTYATEAVEPLIIALRYPVFAKMEYGQVGEPLHSVRVEAAYALGGIGDQRAVAALIAALDDEEEFVQIAASDALGPTGK
jgi:HEAT repeat protein